jgi:putative membrane protein
MKNYLVLFIKGIGMGAANVIPGVSGGTVALITNIFERLIDSIKSFNINALQLLLKGRFKEFVQHTDLYFLIAVFAGALFSVFSLAKLLGFLFENYPVQIWAYFFGLILASVYFVGRTIDKWTLSVIITFIIGTTVAVAVSVLSPASQNDSFVYLVLCGVVAICSMILPGLSGSFVLLLMGNYELVMIEAVSGFNLGILLPVAIGAVIGLVAFSHFLSWIYKKFKNQTIATLSGFIFGSLMILWPWKNEIFIVDENNVFVLKDNEKILQGYEWFVPEISSTVVWAIIIMMAGIASIWLMEKMASEKELAKEVQ